jgi:hypothetical protein
MDRATVSLLPLLPSAVMFSVHETDGKKGAPRRTSPSSQFLAMLLAVYHARSPSAAFLPDEFMNR